MNFLSYVRQEGKVLHWAAMLCMVELPPNFFNKIYSAFQQVCMVLMKLHLNLGYQDLAYWFGVNPLCHDIPTSG